jgi:hypothetical protein
MFSKTRCILTQEQGIDQQRECVHSALLDYNALQFCALLPVSEECTASIVSEEAVGFCRTLAANKSTQRHEREERGPNVYIGVQLKYYTEKEIV